MSILKGDLAECSLNSTVLIVQVMESYEGNHPNHRIPVTILEVKTEGNVRGLERGDSLEFEIQELRKISPDN